MLLYFVEDSGSVYGTKWVAPMGWLHDIFFFDPPWKIRVLDHLMILSIVLAGGRGGAATRVAPMRTAVFVEGAAVAFFFVWGVATGGDPRAASWQTYLVMSGVLFAFAMGAVCQTTEDAEEFGKALLVAGAYRGIMCWLFYFLYVRSGALDPNPPAYMTEHDDTVLWVVCIILLLVYIVEARGIGKRLKAGIFALFLLGAVQFNGRRLAWVSLAMGLAVFFFLLPPGKAKRTVVRAIFVAVPAFALYVAVGWGRTEPMFKPLQSFQTVATQEDASTKARNVENLGLIATANAYGSLTGSGWGHRYVELSDKYQIHEFELWPFIPHNSILGLLAYSGILGAMGFWFPFSTAMYLNARLAYQGRTPMGRRAGVIAATQMVVCANQMYGDMGIFSSKTIYILAASYGIAMRLPAVDGVWSSSARSARPAASGNREGAPAARS